MLLRQVTRGEYEDPEERRKKIEEYRAELLAKDPHELQELYKEERAKERVETEVGPDWEDRQRFFNRPHAKADFIHWSKAAHWTLDEAVALCLARYQLLLAGRKCRNIPKSLHSLYSMRSCVT